MATTPNRPDLEVLDLGTIEDVKYAPGPEHILLSNIRHEWGWSDAYNVGYKGTGPCDFAMNILYHFTNGYKGFANKWHIDFCVDVISKRKRKVGVIKKEEILDWIASREGKEPVYDGTDLDMPNNFEARELAEQIIKKHYKTKGGHEYVPFYKRFG